MRLLDAVDDEEKVGQRKNFLLHSLFCRHVTLYIILKNIFMSLVAYAVKQVCSRESSAGDAHAGVSSK
jgi:hypothetical protein